MPALSSYWLGPGLLVLFGVLIYGLIMTQINRLPWRYYWSTSYLGFALMAFGLYFAIGFRKGVIATMCGAIMMFGGVLAISAPKRPKTK